MTDRLWEIQFRILIGLGDPAALDVSNNMKTFLKNYFNSNSPQACHARFISDQNIFVRDKLMFIFDKSSQL